MIKHDRRFGFVMFGVCALLLVVPLAETATAQVVRPVSVTGTLAGNAASHVDYLIGANPGDANNLLNLQRPDDTEVPLDTGASLADALATVHAREGTAHHESWTRQTGAGNPEFVFDLGADTTIGSVILWQYGNNGGLGPENGGNSTREFELIFHTDAEGAGIDFGSEAVEFSGVMDPIYGDLDVDNVAQPFGFGFQEDYRYVGLRIASNYSPPADPIITAGGDRYGLGEVRFAVEDIGLGPHISLQIDRDTGDVVIANTGGSDFEVLGYSITSDAGALDQSGWTTIAGNYDATVPNGGTGDGSVDLDGNWTVLSTGGSSTDLSEADLEGGDGGTISVLQTVDLGSPWIRTPFENLSAEVLLVGGAVMSMRVAYTGDAIALGDLNADGLINGTDWTLFKAGQGADFTGLSVVEGYFLGDLDNDSDHDLSDFGLFEGAFDAENGVGSFRALLANVPEPGALALLLIGGAFALLGGTRRSPMAALVLGGCFLISSADAAVVQPVAVDDTAANTFNNATYVPDNLIGAVHAAVLGDAPANTDNWVTANNTGDYFAGGGTSVLVFDLGADTDLGGIHYWAYSVGTGNGTMRQGNSVADFSLAFATDAEGPGGIGNSITLNPAFVAAPAEPNVGGNGVDQPVQTFGFGQVVNARYVEMTLLDNYSGAPDHQGGDRAGINEIAFNTDAISSIGNLQIHVDTVTGEVALHNETGTDVTLDSYQITSDTTPSLDPFGWTSISSQSIPGFPSGDGSGNGWEEGPNSDESELTEWYLDDEGAGSTLVDGGAIRLGQAYDEEVDGQDLVFSYRKLIEGTATIRSGNVNSFYVNYVSSVLGDMDGDGDVDGDDVNPFVQALTDRENYDANGYTNAVGLSINADIIGDVNGDGDFNLGDIAAFKSAVNTSSGTESTVPEPSSLLLLAMAGVALLWNRKLGGHR